ncbi:MAG: MFS transporter [Acidobacteriota bacterium]|jgi:MFS family permease|nr:MFS transporter [Acidobacteriota bacterium]
MSSKTNEALVKTPSYAWVVLFALYMATLAAPLNMFKLPPVITTLQEAFPEMDSVASGDLMSIFSIMGFVLAIPAGFILKRFGIKLTVLFSVGTVAVGTALGAISETLRMLFVGRFIEGIGMGLVMVAAPFAISLWFPAHNRALPTGIWATSIGVGNVVTLVAAPSLAGAYGWQSVWWIGAGFAALAFVLFAIFFRMPRQDEMPEAPAPPAATNEAPPSLASGMRNINYWLIGIGFGVYNLVVMAMCTFLPTFLELSRGYSRTYDNGLFLNASFVTAFIMLASVFSAPGGGYISDKLGSRKAVVLVCYAVMTLTFLVPFSVTGWQIPVYMLVFGLFGGPIAPILLAAVPEVSKRPQLIGIGMACSALCQNAGMYLGPTLFIRIQTGQVAQGVPDVQAWATAGYWMIPICIIGALAVWRIKVR